MKQIKFVYISRSKFTNLAVKDPDTLYFIYNEKVLYKGDQPYGGVQDITTAPDASNNTIVSIIKNDGTTDTITIPFVGNGIIALSANDVEVGFFKTNQNTGKLINFDIPTVTSIWHDRLSWVNTFDYGTVLMDLGWGSPSLYPEEAEHYKFFKIAATGVTPCTGSSPVLLYGNVANSVTGVVNIYKNGAILSWDDLNTLLDVPNHEGKCLVISKTGKNSTTRYNLVGVYSSLYQPVHDGILNIKQANMDHRVWRTPSNAELDYILNGRSDPYRFAKCTIDGTKCLVIFPDGYTNPPVNVYNDETAAYEDNPLTEAAADIMQHDGCVFLPLTGARVQTQVQNVNSIGHYWTTTFHDGSNAMSLHLDGDHVQLTQAQKYAGYSVRLVTDTDWDIGPFTINGDGDTVNFAPGNIQYNPLQGEWKFATKQWDVIGEDNENIDPRYDGWLDLFGWGTSGYDCGYDHFMPYDTSMVSYDYYNNGDLNLEDHSDWGYAVTAQNTRYNYDFTANQANNTTIELAKVAFTGNYKDLNNIPEEGWDEYEE